MPAIRCLVLKANEKTIALQSNSVAVNWVYLLILEKMLERQGHRVWLMLKLNTS